MSTSTPKVTLYTYFRSSCSARLRISLALKQIPYESIPINLLKNEQASTRNTTVNPSATVPTLIIEPQSDGNKAPQEPVTITQSLPALEYLEEAFPERTPLLPALSDPQLRAKVRTLAAIVAVDVQPVTNLRILQRVAPYGVDRAAWSKDLVEAGFAAYEAIAATTAGKFSVGDEITLADVCLVPAVWGAERVGVDLGKYPTIKRVSEALEGTEAVRKGHWRAQEDTPEEFRF